MIVVTGATGNVGRPLTASLVGAGHVVTAVARGTSAGLPGGPGIRPVAADLADPAAAQTLELSMTGAEALFLLVPGSGAEVDAAALLEAARAGGVGRVVLLSSQAVGTRPDAAAFAPMAGIEAAVIHSGLEWSILRAGGLATNAFAWAPGVHSRQAVVAPYGDVALPAIDPLDIAEVAAAVLAGDGNPGRTYVLTGPEATSPRQRTQIIAAATQQDLAFIEISPDEAREQMIQFMLAPAADATLAILGHPTAEETRVSLDVEKVLGHPGRSFADRAERNAAAFCPV